MLLLHLFDTNLPDYFGCTFCYLGRWKIGARQWRTEGWEGLGFWTPPPEIPKALQNRAKLKPIWKLLKIAEFRTPTHKDVRKKKQ